jgi:hypothetical protein
MQINKSLFLPVFIFLCSCNDPASISGPETASNIKSDWISNAFQCLTSGKYPRIKAVAWWHENFDNSYLRIDSSPESLEAYKSEVSSGIFITEAVFKNNKLSAPENGIYHAAYPDFGGTEDIVAAERINAFTGLIEKDIVWAYFSNNWYDNILFPKTAVTTIHNTGKIPFIRMMARSNFDEGGPDPAYTMQRIIDGDFDEALHEWAKKARATNIPLLVEFGTEMNGDWFPWNGKYNGGGETSNYGDVELTDGPERFVDAYKHIIDICNENNAGNITWFFHIDAYGQPDKPWNNFANYYPGDDYIDWIGVSVYGPQEPNEDFQSFDEIMGDVYPQLTDLSNKPLAILEIAITELGDE